MLRKLLLITTLCFAFPALAGSPQTVAPPAEEVPAVDDTVVEMEVPPEDAKARSGEKLSLELKTGAPAISFSPEGFTDEQMQNYRGMAPEEQQRFLRNRERILRTFGGILGAVRKPIAVAQKLGSRLSRPKSDEDREARRQVLASTLDEVGLKGAESILRRVDAQLWASAPFFARINELGVSLEVGAAGGAKVGRMGVFMIGGIGISLAVDPNEKALVAEVFIDLEWTRRATPGYAGAEAFASAFGNATYHDWSKPLRPEAGDALSLPGLAGCLTTNNARIGVAKGIGVGFPGAAALESSIVRVPILRVGISPKWTGLVRGKFLASDFLTRPAGWCGAQIVKGCKGAATLLGLRTAPKS